MPRAQEALDAAGEVVDVACLLNSLDVGAGIAAAWPASRTNVTPERSAALHAVDELRGFEPGVLLLDARRVVGGAELGRKVGHRDPHPEADGDRVDVGDAVSSASSAAFALTSSAWTPPVKRTTTAEYSASPVRRR